MTPSSAQVDLKPQYSEGGSAVRHYSLCILNVRVVTLAQGLILLAGASFLIREGMLFLSLVVSGFGLFFSIVLWALQRSYWVCFDCMLDAVIRLEEYSRPSDLTLGPWAGGKHPARKAALQFPPIKVPGDSRKPPRFFREGGDKQA